MIPKIIHQTWKNKDVPKEFIPFQKKVKGLHPDWEYKLWTDEDNLTFVKQYFQDFYSTYISLPSNIMRADMIRYFIMYRIGGIYLDLDYEMLKPFDLLDYGLVLPYNRSKSFGDAYDGFGNCIFGSAPGHPFWKYVIDDFKVPRNYGEFFKTLLDKPYIPKDTPLEIAITGPGLLTRIFYSYQDKLQDYILPEREVFHPLNPGSDNEYAEIIAKGVSYGIHHCAKTWIDKSLLKRIKNRIKNLLTVE
ncbi:MAG TPA: glycosyltransferase [Syntrophales bacterium]|jgi:mannosyltransferase OCH1-like enzyme|nr:glycosyltransferase [Syntrophales bacterium]